MKKHFSIGIAILAIVTLTSCSKSRFGELTGVDKRKKWSEPTPYGMNFIHQGSFHLGPNDQEVSSLNTPTKTVSVDAFWMDDTEITNNEYRQFVYWVRDSIAMRELSNQYPVFINSNSYNHNNQPILNWKKRIDWEDSNYQMAMQNLYVPQNERFLNKNEIDPRKLVYEYWWIDLQQAAQRRNSYNFQTQMYNGLIINLYGDTIKTVIDRSSFFMHESIPIYPDTLCWIRDFSYSYNDPRTRRYFYHPAFDEYPVVGVSWKQANAFCNWRTNYRNDNLPKRSIGPEEDYRLPTEAEWEYAARGGKEFSMYPWGSYYTREQNGVFMANFKPDRGNYVEDGGIVTLKVRTYDPNDFGLYDMAGSVAEWTSNAFYESAYDIINDFNPNIEYNAIPEDPPVLKRKVIRGGSWKDISAFLQVGTRSYEYQDTTKSYIGFRCVRSSFCDVTEIPFGRKSQK